jgi:hypothetical protein
MSGLDRDLDQRAIDELEKIARAQKMSITTSKIIL